MPSVTDAPAAFLAFGGEAATGSRTGYITACARALSRRSDPPEIANDDDLADVFLLPLYRVLLRAPRLTRRLSEWLTPGAVAYFNARTRHIDAIVRERIAAGLGTPGGSLPKAMCVRRAGGGFGAFPRSEPPSYR